MSANAVGLRDILARLAESQSDDEAWAALYRQMRPFVLAVLYRKLRGMGEIAEDASQEVFMRLARSRPFPRLQDPDEFRAYLWRVADNVARTYLRALLKRRARETRLDVAPMAEVSSREQPSPDEDVAAMDLIQNLLFKLSIKDRELIGFLIQGHTLPDIVKATGLSYQAVAVRLHRLRGKLRNHLIVRDFSRQEKAM